MSSMRFATCVTTSSMLQMPTVRVAVRYVNRDSDK